MRIWPFNRKQQSEALPEEVQEYYEAGRKQQTGMAWLLAFGTLVVTIALAVVLFFGGRWVYQQFAGDDEPQQPTTQEATTQDQDQANKAQPQTDEPESPEADNPQSNSSTNNQQGSSSTNTDQSTPNTGAGDSEIPDTGPGPGGLQ